MLQFTSAGSTAANQSESDGYSSPRGVSTAIIVAALIIMSLPLSACNTFGGVGKDIEAAGDAIADTNEGTED